jgi:hypothetical protein
MYFKTSQYRVGLSTSCSCCETLLTDNELSSYVSLKHSKQQIDKMYNVGEALLFIQQ